MHSGSPEPTMITSQISGSIRGSIYEEEKMKGNKELGLGVKSVHNEDSKLPLNRSCSHAPLRTYFFPSWPALSHNHFALFFKLFMLLSDSQRNSYQNDKMAVVSSRNAVNAVGDPFAEHTSIMKALYHDYQRRDELEGIALVEALLLEAAQACKQKEDKAKILIRGGSILGI